MGGSSACSSSTHGRPATTPAARRPPGVPSCLADYTARCAPGGPPLEVDRVLAVPAAAGLDGRHNASVALGGDCLADIAVLRERPGLAGPAASDPVVSRLVTALATDALRSVRLGCTIFLTPTDRSFHTFLAPSPEPCMRVIPTRRRGSQHCRQHPPLAGRCLPGSKPSGLQPSLLVRRRAAA